MVETTQEVPQQQPQDLSFAEFKKARAEGKPVTSDTSTAAEPVTQPDTVADAGAAKDIQDGQPPKRDRSAAGRAKELIAAGRVEEAEKILEAAAKKDRERAERAEQELQTLRTRKPDEAAPPATQPQETKAEAKALKGFLQEYFERNREASYEDGLEAYYADKFNPDKLYSEVEKRLEAKAGRDAEAKAQQDAQKAHAERLDKAREKYDDFDEVYAEGIKAAEGVPVNPGFSAAMSQSDALGDLLYHFSKNPHELREIAVMTPQQAFNAVFSLGYKLSGGEPTPNPGKPKLPPSAAPAPVAPLGGASGGSGRPDPIKARSFSEYKRARQG